MTDLSGGGRNGETAYRVRYLHQNTGAVARFHPMSLAAALEIARQLIFDGETQVLIEDPDGDAFTVEGLSAPRRRIAPT